MHKTCRRRGHELAEAAEWIAPQQLLGLRKKPEVALKRGLIAEHAILRAAIMAGATGQPWVHVDTIADGNIADLSADFGNGPGRIESHHRRQRRQAVPV